MREKNQVVLPLNLGICIPEGDFVFKVAEICESLDYTELFNTYVRKWRKVNPITLFEIVVFGYMEHLYSGRDIAKACKTDIRFMWLLNGEPAPSHATITRFQDERLSEVFYLLMMRKHRLNWSLMLAHGNFPIEFREPELTCCLNMMTMMDIHTWYLVYGIPFYIK